MTKARTAPTDDVIDLIDHDSLLGYATKYNIPLDYAQTIYNMIFLAGPSLDSDETFRFRMPANESEVGTGSYSGELIEVGIDRARGAVIWIGIEGVNTDTNRDSVGQASENSKRQSKLDVCRRLFDSSKRRKDNIKMFIDHADCTPAGAATYYAKINSGK